MRNLKLIPIHYDYLNAFSNQLYIELDKKLMVVDVGTPAYNDYNEYRLHNIFISLEDYDENDNEDNIKVVKPVDFPEISITETELEYLLLKFQKQDDKSYDLNYEKFKLTHNCTDIDLATDEPLLSAVYYLENENSKKSNIHFQTMKAVNNDNFKEPDYFDFKEDKCIQKNEWINKESLLKEQGIYNILIPIIEWCAEYNRSKQK